MRIRLLIQHQLSEFKNLLGDHSNFDPPDSMPNSVVKRISADGSVGLPHVRVGHRQASKKENSGHSVVGVLFFSGALTWFSRFSRARLV